MIDDEGNVHLTREYLLSDLEQLQKFYDIFGEKRMISWILKKNSKNEKQS